MYFKLRTVRSVTFYCLMEGVISVLVLAGNELEFQQVRRQVLAKYINALLVRAADMKQLQHRANWAVFDVALVNYNLPEHEAHKVMLFLWKHFPDLPFILLVDKRRKYSEADIAIIKQADGCVYREELFGPVGIIDGLVRTSRKRNKVALPFIDRSFKLSKAIRLFEGRTGFNELRDVLALPGDRAQHSVVRRFVLDKANQVYAIGSRPVEIDILGEDPHVLVGADAGAE